jgi:outer membrane receptor protein involved in Fe transport
MKQILYTFFAFTSLVAVAQRPSGATKIAGSGIIQGTIVDSLSGEKVEFAAVALWTAGKPIDGTLTTSNGKFKFEGISKGTYRLLISFVGYKPLSINDIEVKSNASTVDLKDVFLLGDNLLLDEVKVVAQTALIEDKIDRLVYNADKDISNRGGTAEEVLRKVPMLSVDLDGEVELRGSSNVRVLINNKPSAIFASSVGEALKQIPADQIKTVEVITSPSAKYDGDGSAGIVNIILKKNTLSGITGSLNTGIGIIGSDLNGSLNLRDEKWGISIKGGGRASYNFKTVGENTRESVINGAATYLTQLDNNKGTWGGGRYSGTFDYDFNDKTNFSIQYSASVRGNGGKGDQTTTLLNANKVLIFENVRYIDQTSRSNSNDVDFTFTKRYANPVQELQVLAQLSENNRNDFFIAQQNGISADSSENLGVDKELNFQVDYVQPLGKKMKWEVGGKGIFRSATSDGRFYSFKEGRYTLNSLRSNFLDYNQDVAAGYSSFTLELPKKWGIQAGMRYEKTIISAQFKERSDVEIPNYHNWLPSINISKRFETGTSLRASYTQRIQRPSIRYLNPYVNYSNANSISFGQPTLSPELVDMMELTYNTFFKSNSINLSVYSRIEDNSITSISNVTRTEGIDVTETTYANIGVNKRYGVNISMNLNPTKSWRLSGGVNTDYTYMDNRTISNKGWNAGLNLNTSYNFSKGIAASLFAFYRSPSVQLQGTRNGFYFHGLNVKKDINGKRGSIGLGLENPFVRKINFNSKLNSFIDAQNYFISANNRSIYRRSIKLDFRYKFGKMDADGKRLFNRKRGNSDAMDGDGGGEEQGGGSFR